jgi:hypothetical protein
VTAPPPEDPVPASQLTGDPQPEPAPE